MHPTAPKPHSTHDCFVVRRLINEFKEKNKGQQQKSGNKEKESAQLTQENSEDTFDFGGMASTMINPSSSISLTLPSIQALHVI